MVNQCKTCAHQEGCGLFPQEWSECKHYKEIVMEKTYVVKVYCGLKEGYDGEQHNTKEAHDIIQEYVNGVGLCVTVTEVEYIYVNGREMGVEVGLINYPRFPSSEEEINKHAVSIAQLLKDGFNQNRVTVVYPDHTEMIGERE